MVSASVGVCSGYLGCHLPLLSLWYTFSTAAQATLNVMVSALLLSRCFWGLDILQ